MSSQNPYFSRGENMKKLYLFLAVMTVFAMALSACAPATPVATEAPAKPTAVPPTAVPPTATEAPAPELGTPDNPLIMALAPSATTQELQTGGDAIRLFCGLVGVG